MKTPDCPINVVVYNSEGKADNHDCTGPSQLRTWLNEGRINPQTQVFARRVNKWMTAESYLGWAERKSDTENLCDMDATLTNLVGVAEELNRLTALAAKREQSNDRPRDFRKHWKAERSDGNSNSNNEPDSSELFGSIKRAHSY